MKNIPAAWALVICLLSPAPGRAAGPPPSRHKVLEKIRLATAGIKTLSGNFMEEKRWVLFKAPVRIRGRFYYMKPHRLRWEQTTPEIEGFAVSKDQGIRWRKDPSRAVPFHMDSTPALKHFTDQVFAWIQGDFTRIRKRYRVTVAPNLPVSVTLTPLSEAEKAFLDRIVIVFSRNLKHVQTVHIHEKDGDATRIRFTGVQINGPVDPKLFP